ncbi:MAG: GNAT family N-acetyltransferase [Alphaproteobacteria bacterium]|nr:GNAT family N-acetyltransferase [Alphaproteobacteria bacterium]
MELPIIKSTVTYLEMRKNPYLVEMPIDGFELRLEEKPAVETYIDIYREVGRDYIWNYRPAQSVQEIEEIIQSGRTRLYYLYKDKTPIGMAELDVTKPDDVELVHFGLLPAYTDSGLGRKFLSEIIRLTWGGGASRLWLSTCGLDHPKAIKFYENAGFSVFKTREGEFKDYRYSDFYDMKDAPQIPHGVGRHG